VLSVFPLGKISFLRSSAPTAFLACSLLRPALPHMEAPAELPPRASPRIGGGRASVCEGTTCFRISSNWSLVGTSQSSYFGGRVFIRLSTHETMDFFLLWVSEGARAVISSSHRCRCSRTSPAWWLVTAGNLHTCLGLAAGRLLCINQSATGRRSHPGSLCKSARQLAKNRTGTLAITKMGRDREPPRWWRSPSYENTQCGSSSARNVHARCCRGGAEEQPRCKHEERRDAQPATSVVKAEALCGGVAHLTLFFVWFGGFCF